MKALLKSYRQAPRKVRLVANLMKGKTVDRALVELDHLAKRASLPMKKLLLSAVANAKQNSGIEQSALFVKEVRVDQGAILKRSMPRARGSASPIHKHTSHVMIELVAHVDTDKADAKKAKAPAVAKENDAPAKAKKATVKKVSAKTK
ncbi:MAG: 50S ribosomal protein L22 [Patescibacteria group bacterium]